MLSEKRQDTDKSEQEFQKKAISAEDKKITEALLTAYVYFTVKQFCKRHQAFTEGGIRHNIFHEKTNGLSKSGAIVRVGRKVLINESKFFRWLESQNQPI